MRRWLRFSQRLAELGHEIVVFTPSDASYPIIDDKLKAPSNITQHQVGFFEWRDVYQKLLKANSKDKSIEKNKIDRVFYEGNTQKNYLKRVALWIRANFFIPDARANWIKPCSQAVLEYLETNQADYIISTGPPQSCHLIAQRVKKKHPELTWLADFRDPWTRGAFFDKLPLSRASLSKHTRLESSVLTESDIQLTVSPTWANELKQLGGKNVHHIYNSYVLADFKASQDLPQDQYVMSHIGTVYKDRSPREFWLALKNYLDENPQIAKKFTLQLVGQISQEVIAELEEIELSPYVKLIGVLGHQDALEILKQSDILLLLVNDTKDHRGRIPAKLLEYLATDKPILLVGPDRSDAKDIIENGLLHFDPSTHDTKKLRTLMEDKMWKTKITRAEKKRYSTEFTTDQLIQLLLEQKK